jgi:hypothetical protein
LLQPRFDQSDFRRESTGARMPATCTARDPRRLNCAGTVRYCNGCGLDVEHSMRELNRIADYRNYKKYDFEGQELNLALGIDI